MREKDKYKRLTVVELKISQIKKADKSQFQTINHTYLNKQARQVGVSDSKVKGEEFKQRNLTSALKLGYD